MSHESHNGDEDTGLSAFDDVAAHSKLLKDTMARAKQIITLYRRGFTRDEKKSMKTEIPKLAGELRQLLFAQLQKEGAIYKLDRSDDSYDNVFIDDELRKQLATLRNIHINLNTLIGTRTVRKLSAFIVEDIPNLFTVKWRQLKDNLWQLGKSGVLAIGVGGAAAVAGYSLAQGGIVPGMTVLGEHLSTVGAAAWKAGETAAPHIVDAAHKIRYGISWTLSKLSALFHPGTVPPSVP